MKNEDLDLNMNDEKELEQFSGLCGSDCDCNWESMYKNELERNTTLEENNNKLIDMQLKTKDELDQLQKKFSKIIKLYNELLGHYLNEE